MVLFLVFGIMCVFGIGGPMAIYPVVEGRNRRKQRKGDSSDMGGLLGQMYSCLVAWSVR